MDDWYAGGDPAMFKSGLAKKQYNGNPVYYLRSLKDIDYGFGTYMSETSPKKYNGKRLKLTAYIKCENVEYQCALWMRIDGRNTGEMLGFDNMNNRPIYGTTDWKQYSIVLDVPDSSVNIAYGILLNRTGSMWISDVKMEVVGNDVAVTNMLQQYFSADLDEWFKAGSKPDSYEIGASDEKRNDKTVYFIKSTAENIGGFGTILSNVIPAKYIGKRLRLSGDIKTENVSNYAGMWMRVDGSKQGEMLGFDNMHDRPIKGTNDWAKYEIVLDVPEGSTNIGYGLLINETGHVWINNFVFEEVGTDIPVTNTLK